MLENFYSYIVSIIGSVRIQDILDILIVSYVIYHGIRLLRETRAVQLFKGILIIVVVLQLSSWLKLHMINYILINTVQVGAIALIIVFQPELRNALERMGRSNISKFFKFDDTNGETIEDVIEQICIAADKLSGSKTGALMVMERSTKIGDIIRTGVPVDSKVNAKLIVNIFVPNSPLHDGAIIIRNNRIAAAACFLPLTQHSDLNVELGTRHRAALGMTESSDALVVIISEETGKISLAMEGSLTRNLTVESLGKVLIKYLAPEEPEKSNKLHVPWKNTKS